MTKPMVRIHNTKTNEVIDREMTDKEFADYEAEQLKDKARQAKIEAQILARVKLLERLGITADEAQLLLS